jgi:hypothetical protein
MKNRGTKRQEAMPKTKREMVDELLFIFIMNNKIRV